jgi:hypothetical protein
MRRTSSAGTVDAPVDASRRLETSVAAMSGCDSINDHCVGTPWATVTRSHSMSRSASTAFHGVGVMTVVIARSSSSHTRVM